MQQPAAYQDAIARTAPCPLAIATARDPQGKFNPITLAWFMCASQEPPMLAIAVGKARHSLAAIEHSGCFVVSYLSSSMQRDAIFHGTKSGRELDKLAECGTATQPAQAIDGVLLSDAVANFECRLDGRLEAGDHVIFTGQVVAAHVNADPRVRMLFALGQNRMGAVQPL